MADDMFFYSNARCLRRGNRRSKRSTTDREVIFWERGLQDYLCCGRLRNVSSCGLLILSDKPVPVSSVLEIQLQHGHTSKRQVLAHLQGKVVRADRVTDGRYHIGIELIQNEINRAKNRGSYRIASHRQRLKLPERRRKSRMYTIDVTIGKPASGGLGSWK